MEAVNQFQGFMVYSVLLETKEGTLNLTFENVKDVGLVFTTDTLAKSLVFHGTVAGRATLNITVDEAHPILSILTECRGHINYGTEMIGDIKGIVGRVYLNGQELLNWMMKQVDFRSVNPPVFESLFPDPGVVYRGVLHITSSPKDTFAVMNSVTRVCAPHFH